MRGFVASSAALILPKIRSAAAPSLHKKKGGGIIDTAAPGTTCLKD